MRQSNQIRFISGLVAVFMFVFTSELQSQQKIQVNSNGHFSVEILHNKAGAPMKYFTGEGGDIVVDNLTNNFILRIGNLNWFDVDSDQKLLIDTDKISSQSDCEIVFENQGRVYKVQPIKSVLTDIRFSTKGFGLVKLGIPFNYGGSTGQFTQEFRIIDKATQKAEKEKQSEKEEKALSRSQIREIWNALDKDNIKSVKSFVLTFQDNSKAKLYVNQASQLIADVEKKELAKAKEMAKSKNSGNSNTIISDSDELKEEISAIVDTLNNQTTVSDVLADSYLLEITNEGRKKSHDVLASEMPLQIVLHEEGELEDQLLNSIPVQNFKNDTLIELNLALLNENKIKGDFNSYTVHNAYGEELFTENISLNSIKKKKGLSMLYIAGLSLLLLGFGGFVIYSRRSKEKLQKENKEKIKQKIAANKEKEVKQSNSSPVPPKAKVKQSKIVIGQKKKEELVPAASIARKPGSKKIIIKSKKKSGLETPYEDFAKIVNQFDSVQLDLTKIWTDSAIKNVYLAPDYIKELDNFLADSSNDGIQNELQGAIPEVGGFMMGRYTKKDGFLDVFVEKFVPFVPEYNDVFKIEIGTKTIVDELGDAQDKNPDLNVIGWFHTHPGHGLFLSTSDLSVQRHFPKDYQVAMEIDSLTNGLDMSIFTRKSNGRMNNSADRIENTGWFQWVDIDNNNT